MTVGDTGARCSAPGVERLLAGRGERCHRDHVCARRRKRPAGDQTTPTESPTRPSRGGRVDALVNRGGPDRGCTLPVPAANRATRAARTRSHRRVQPPYPRRTRPPSPQQRTSLPLRATWHHRRRRACSHRTHVPRHPAPACSPESWPRVLTVVSPPRHEPQSPVPARIDTDRSRARTMHPIRGGVGDEKK